jgi:hypothetical protein
LWESKEAMQLGREAPKRENREGKGSSPDGFISYG